jgi:hypothetical protein
MILIVIALTVQISDRNIQDDDLVARTLQATIEPDARVMLNDPSGLYYYTGIWGVTLPNETPEVALEIAEIYDIDYLLLETDEITDPLLFEEAPDFLIPIEFPVDGVRLYAFDRD